MTPYDTDSNTPEITAPSMQEGPRPPRPLLGTLLYLLLAFGLTALFAVSATLLLGLSGNAPQDDPENFVVSLIVFTLSLAGAVVATAPFVRRGNLTWTDAGFGRRHVLFDTGIGVLLGVASFSLVPLVARLFQWTTFEAGDLSVFPAYAASVGIVLLPAAAFEEVFSRGLPLHYLRQLRIGGLTPGRATVLAVLLTSLLFSFLHAWNPGFNAIAFLEVVAAGVALAVARIRSGALWLPIGWHFGWNASQDILYGFSVSGVTAGSGALLRASTSGPPMLVGGAFGPESGLLTVFATVLFTILFAAFYPKR
ncbi:MAG: CPBP family intramembrane metalloprotease [Gemmatimonadetes bacterium]|nr:CPBP family intramembrane metalloprotease [Gemmatimonadota bacterium]